MVILVGFLVLPAGAQNSGASSFAFLDVPSSAKLAGLGGVNSSLFNNDVNLFINNPALLSPSQSMSASINYALYPESIGLSSITYAQEFEKIGLFGAGLQYMSYGTINGYDDTGAYIGDFSPGDFAVSISHSRVANNFRMGATIKFVGTNIAGYQSNAILFDAGGLFIHPDKDLTVGLAMTNFGFITQRFFAGSETSLPFDIQLGTSFKPEHMPVRFTFTLQKLHQWDLLQPFEKNNGQNKVLDNIFRHIVIGSEILLSPNVNILFAYNHLRRKELKLESISGFSGFSVGTLIKVKSFELVYAFAGYHVAGNTNTFTLTSNLSDLIIKN